ncbi:hypothetical protein ONE63_007507 [Megalurothrips usitatus]|uniref:Uncharacterized protein n=1 Tax=Megalurothrips usitatus TaxID=439358 RepID=A0AAV7XMY6_9NEOP|nr:hypothetical protein ONE63_007507 [Megalurothrips usitatus]
MKSTVQDPWKTNHEESLSNCSTGRDEDELSMCFEDSFVACSRGDCDETSNNINNRLPDSAEYLASLENKLAKLKSKRKSKDMVKSLQDKNMSSMIHFLSDENRTVMDDDDFILDTPVSNSHPLMRHVAPDKQALTVGELVELLKADQLAHVLEQETEEGSENEERPN